MSKDLSMAIETLGRASFPSGRAVVIDTGTLSGDGKDQWTKWADADAIAAWRDDVSLDGHADFVFWGRDAEALAGTVDAPRLRDGTFGWCDRAVDEIVALGTMAEETRTARRWKLRTDFRPHTHHFLMLADARASATQSGELELEGSRTCMFFTSWGDGAFPVFADRDSLGNLLRVRVQLQTEDSVAAMDAVNG